MVEAALGELAAGPRHRLSELAASPAPATTGVYALWHDTTLLYVGISARNPADTTNRQAAGVRGRLNTYRRAPLTSEFAVSCALRYIIPTLTTSELGQLAAGTLTMRDMQARVRDWLWTHISFSAVSTPDGASAAAIEAVARTAGLPGHGPPAFNAVAARA